MKKIVSLGGGHGLSMVLRTLLPCDVEQTAIVSVADDGGSSGRLRHDLDIVAPGDIRSCIRALSLIEDQEDDIDTTIAQLFDYRFDKGELDGHSLGNLMLVALARNYGSFEVAVQKMSALLKIRGRVLPATESNVILCAKTANGLVKGQVEIEKSHNIENVFLEPDNVTPLAGVIESIQEADHIIYAPGSLFTSVIPVFLIPEITHALKIANADKTMIMNLAHKGSDTEGMTGDDMLNKVIVHQGSVDRVICDIDSLNISKQISGVTVVSANLKKDTDTHDDELLRLLLVDILGL